MNDRITDERLRELATWEPGAKTSALSAQRAEWIAMARELADLREQTRWRPMEEAPRDGTAILASLDGSSDLSAVVRYHDGGWVVAWDHYRLDSGPRCWMPLPEIGPLPGGDV